MTSPFKMPRNFGPCVRCGKARKQKVSDLCPECKRADRNRRYRKTAKAKARLKRNEERALQEMEMRPLVRTRHRAETATSTASQERELSIDSSGFWKRWLDSPDNLCTSEALDRAGW